MTSLPQPGDIRNNAAQSNLIWEQDAIEMIYLVLEHSGLKWR